MKHIVIWLGEKPFIMSRFLWFDNFLGKYYLPLKCLRPREYVQEVNGPPFQIPITLMGIKSAQNGPHPDVDWMEKSGLWKIEKRIWYISLQINHITFQETGSIWAWRVFLPNYAPIFPLGHWWVKSIFILSLHCQITKKKQLNLFCAIVV